jgi:hypothetical protein
VWIGGDLENIITDPTLVMKWIEEFPLRVQDHAFVIHREFLPYSAVVRNLPDNATAPDLEAAQRTMDKLATLAGEADGYIASLKYIKDYSFQFPPVVGIDDRLGKLKTQRDNIEALANDIIKHSITANLNLPYFDLKEAAGAIPDALDDVAVPIKIEVAGNNGTMYEGDGLDWVGPLPNPNTQILWFGVYLQPSVFNRDPSPLAIRYRVIIVEPDPDGDALGRHFLWRAVPLPRDWQLSDQLYQPHKSIYGISFKLDGVIKTYTI